MEPFTEEALLLGPAKSLVGIITRPAAAIRRADAPLFVILNAGIIHRVGPNRMSVRLARTLAGEGFSVLRFDLSSLGDSGPRSDDLPLVEAGMADVRDALDTLDDVQPGRRVVLMGLCSGADLSVIYAGSDKRVVGTVLLDPAIPRTRGYYVRHVVRRVLSPQSWRRLATGGPAYWRTLGLRDVRAAGADGSEEQRPLLERPEVRKYLEEVYAKAAAQAVQLLAVFTSGPQHRHNSARQLLEAFPNVRFGRRLRLEYFSDSDHTFSSEVNRTRLMEVILDWARATQFGPGAG